MNLIKKSNFKILGDLRGQLISIESKKNIPFEFKRVYYIFGTQAGVSRGFHAHKKLEQLAICISGSCRFILDDGMVKEETILNSPEKGISIPPMIWHEMHDFSDDCVILVLANDYYDESDYIRNYKDFQKEVRYVNN